MQVIFHNVNLICSNLPFSLDQHIKFVYCKDNMHNVNDEW